MKLLLEVEIGAGTVGPADLDALVKHVGSFETAYSDVVGVRVLGQARYEADAGVGVSDLDDVLASRSAAWRLHTALKQGGGAVLLIWERVP